MPEEFIANVISEPTDNYYLEKDDLATIFINPFTDFSFKRIFASHESKPLLIGLLNHLFKGRKCIAAIEYSKNESPGEIEEEGGVVFDVVCTDVDGSRFIIEIQSSYQKNFKDRALFYISRAISEQAPKGDRKKWAYNLTEVYLVAFLDNFSLPNTSKQEYLHDICLTDRATGKVFYDKLGFTFVQMLTFVKQPHELETELDKWLYALKHMTEFNRRPEYLNGPQFDHLFTLAKYANLSKNDRDMYNDSLKRKWDLYSVTETAKEMGLEQGLQEGRKEGLKQGMELGEHKKAVELAIKLKAKNTPVDEIVELTGLILKEIEAL